MSIMATYREIQNYVKAKYGFEPKPCYIADMKEQAGLPVRRAWNRISDERVYPCPVEKKEALLDAFRHFNMI
jgi:hypothetical protein